MNYLIENSMQKMNFHQVDWFSGYAGFSFTPQTEHFPSAVIFGCSLTSLPQRPHFKIHTPPFYSPPLVHCFLS